MGLAGRYLIDHVAGPGAECARFCAGPARRVGRRKLCTICDILECGLVPSPHLAWFIDPSRYLIARRYWFDFDIASNRMHTTSIITGSTIQLSVKAFACVTYP